MYLCDLSSAQWAVLHTFPNTANATTRGFAGRHYDIDGLVEGLYSLEYFISGTKIPLVYPLVHKSFLVATGW